MIEKYSNLPKCNNANYCKYSKDNIHCSGSEEIIDNCLYLKAIEYFALLSKYTTGDRIAPCSQGYHYCTNLFEIFNYYCGELDKDIAIYECEVGDEVIKTGTSKCVTNKIKPVKRLYREDIIRLLNV